MSIFYDFIFMGFDWCLLYVLNYESMFEFLLINIIRRSRSMLIIQRKEFKFCLDLYCFIPRNTEHMIQTSSDCVTLYRFVLFANLEKFVSKQVAPSNCKTHIRALLSSYNNNAVSNWTFPMPIQRKFGLRIYIMMSDNLNSIILKFLWWYF